MSTIAIVQLAENVIKNDLSPIMNTLSGISVYIGIFCIMWGILRLMRHAHQNMMYRVSPWGTVMAFAAGTVLTSFTPELSILSNSLFGINQVFYNTCPGGSTGLHGTYSCPMLGYLQQINDAPEGANMTDLALKTLAYGVLFFFGTLAFIRGWLQLIRVGDGNGGGQVSFSRALTFILAGTIGVNAANVYHLLNGVLTSQFN